jgi:hypothetical protein
MTILIGEGQLVAVFELGAPGDQPRLLRPRRQVHGVGDLADLGVPALGAVDADRLHPPRFWHGGDRFADGLGEIKADREAHPSVATERGQLVACAGTVGAHQDLTRKRRLVELLQREPQHRGVVGGGVRAGVARSQHPRRRLPSAVQVAQQRMMAEAALEVARRVLLVGMRAGQRRIDI